MKPRIAICLEHYFFNHHTDASFEFFCCLIVVSSQLRICILDHLYNTDGLGRVKSVEGDLSLTAMDRNKYQQCVTGKCGEVGDQGGHLIAATLGGAGDRINLVPQAATLNNGAWKAMENEFKAALDAGKKVTVKIEVGYPAGGGVRPNEFKVTSLVNGVQSIRKFTQ